MAMVSYDFPPYSQVPGLFLYPNRHPDGYSFGAEAVRCFGLNIYLLKELPEILSPPAVIAGA